MVDKRLEKKHSLISSQNPPQLNSWVGVMGFVIALSITEV